MLKANTAPNSACAHTTRTHIGVHLLSLRALRLVQYEFAVSAIWVWLVQ